MNYFHFVVALIENCIENQKCLNKIHHNSEAHQSQPLLRAQIELLSLKKTTIETRQFNLIFRGGFGIEHHQFWVHSLMLYRLYNKLIDEAVTFRQKRFSTRSSRVCRGRGVLCKTAVAHVESEPKQVQLPLIKSAAKKHCKNPETAPTARGLEQRVIKVHKQWQADGPDQR